MMEDNTNYMSQLIEQAQKNIEEQNRISKEKLNKAMHDKAESSEKVNREAMELFKKLHLQEDADIEHQMNMEIEEAKARAEAEVRSRYEKQRPSIKPETSVDKALKDMLKKM